MSKFLRCDPKEHGCDKIRFHLKDDANRYAIYLAEEYGTYVKIYWDKKCNCYHFTAAE